MGSGFECNLETIRKAQSDDAMAWEDLVRQNSGWIFQTCGRWAGSHARAEDLTQDVFIRVFQTFHSYRGELGGFRAWLTRITRNLLIDDYRNHRKERGTVSYDGMDEQIQRVICSVPSGRCSPETGVYRQERRAALRRAHRLLGPELREAVTLRDVRGLAYQEISQLLRTPVGTVKSRVNRGRIGLARLMRKRARFHSWFSSRWWRTRCGTALHGCAGRGGSCLISISIRKGKGKAGEMWDRRKTTGRKTGGGQRIAGPAKRIFRAGAR